MWVGISETIRLILFNPDYARIPGLRGGVPKKSSLAINKSSTSISFNQWLAGLIDAKGSFIRSNKDYMSLEITMNITSKHCLYLIKQSFGGSIKNIGGNSIRYRLHHYEGLIKLLKAINGLMYNDIKLINYKKFIEYYNISYIESFPLTLSSAWYSGYFDGKGVITVNHKSNQIFIKLTSKNNNLLEIINKINHTNGDLRYISQKTLTVSLGKLYITPVSYSLILYTKKDILCILDYFKLYPSKSIKKNRLSLIADYFLLKSEKAHLANSGTLLAKKWLNWKLKWESYEE